MGSLVLPDVPSNLLERLELRAKRLGVTPSEEALHLLWALLVEGQGPAALAPEEALEERDGLLVFTGRIDPATIPDVQEVREQRIDELIPP